MRVKHTIAISIITFKRPHSLAHTLQSLKENTIPANADVKLVVVDNDVEQTARHLVSILKCEMPFPIIYIVEPKRGIPHARNRALEAAIDNDYIAFIDDDDTADPMWLSALYNAAQLCKADVVKGQIHYSFPDGKQHLSGLDIFAPIRLPTGSELDSAWTNNVLFSTKIYIKSGLRFDPGFLKTGGSDSYFFRLAKRNGSKIISCQEAVVKNNVPPARTTWKWLALRNMRIGATITISDIKITGYGEAMKKTFLSLADSARYCFRLVPGIFSGANPVIHPAMVVCFMLGRTAGIFYISPREYK